MANKKLLEKKKQKREEVARQRILRKREIKQKTDKLQKEERKKSIEKEPKMEPIMREETKKRHIQEQLEHNMLILKALEDEYEKEMKGRKDIDTQLTEQGFLTLEDRIKEVQRRVGEDSNAMNILQGTGQANFGYEVNSGVGGVK